MKDVLSIYNNELLKKRGWISKIPDSKKAVMIFSGGFDSTITAIRLIKDFHMELFPMYIDRGSRNRESELSSIKTTTDYIKKEFGEDKFHDIFIPIINIPPKEIKPQLQEYAKKNYYPMRNCIMHMYAAQYAASLGDDVRTICDGVTANDPVASLVMSRINTLAVCELTEEPEWNILSLNLDTEICEKPFYKQDEVVWAHQNNIPYEHTVTCWSPIKVGEEVLHCGQCHTCKERQMAFIDSNIKDNTRYHKRINEL